METSPPYGGATMAHELGHNYFSTVFATGEDHVPGCGDPESVNNSYPQYQKENGTNHHRASIGQYGFDGATVFGPSTYKDVMSYCTDRWISPYTYMNLIYALDYMTIVGNASRPNSVSKLPANNGNQEYLVAAGIIYGDGAVEPKPFFTRILPVGTDDDPGPGLTVLSCLTKMELSCLQENSSSILVMQ